MNAPTTFPTNLPALIDALPADSTRPQQTEFTRDKQVAFLSALANGGAVRRAVRAAGIAHQTAYRMRRASAAFRLAWDAALLAARAVAEDVLASRAIEGVEKQVFYHGEAVATRRRYSDRLLLAHLGRLDKLTGDARVSAFAGDFEEALARFERGEAQPEVEPAEAESPRVPADAGTSGHRAQPPEAPASAGACGRVRDGTSGDPDFSSPGQCNMRSMSPADAEADLELDPDPEPASWLDDPRYLRWPDGSHAHRLPPPGYPEWEDDMDDPAHWVGGRYVPPLGRRLAAMEAARPPGARLPHEFAGYSRDRDVQAEQLAAFEAGVDRWWLVVPPDEGEDADEWCFTEEA